MSLFHSNSLIGASGQGGGGGGGYEIERSLRFNSADSAYLSRTPSSAGNRRTFTWAGWIKRCKLGSRQSIFSAGTTNLSGDPGGGFFFNSSTDTLSVVHGGGTTTILTTAQVFRDVSAWFHLVVAYDTTQGTDSNRIKIYVNGTQITISGTYPGSNFQTDVNNTIIHAIGSRTDDGPLPASTADYYLADVHFIDGQALDPTSFGEFDANGVWQPIDASGLTYGTNGFHLPFSDNSTAAALGTDTSGNGNTWTVNNISTFTNKTLPTVIFDGVTDYLSLASSADFAMGTGDFTAEAYIYYSRDFSYAEGGYSPRVFDSNSGQLGIYIAGDGTGQIGAFVGGTDTRSSTVPSLRTWNHVAICRSGTTLRIFLNGTVIHSVTNSNSVASAGDFNIGSRSNGLGGFPGAISNLRLIKGTALYTASFTPPSSPLSNVTNTKLLCCQSSSSTTTATVSPGTITANGNVYANTLTDSQAGEDSLRDTPVNGSQEDTGAGGEVVGNYATLNPLKNGMSLSNGNLTATNSASVYSVALGTIGVPSGKWYWEVTATTASGAAIGVGDGNTDTETYLGLANSFGYTAGGTIYGPGNTQTQSGLSTYTNGDVIGVALDLDSSEVKFYKNNSLAATVTGLSSTTWFPAVTDSTSSGSNPTLDCNFGQRPFAYTAPSGFKALCTTNLPEPTIADGSTAMDVALYTGTGASRSITGLNFSPDWVWIKSRSNGAYHHRLVDTVRGATKEIYSNLTNAEGTDSVGLTAFNSDGFTLGSSNEYNASGQTFVAWTWDAGTSTVSNTSGSITSQVRANASAGFSVVTFTKTGGTSTSATVGHGLGAEPHMIIIKNRDATDEWYVYTKILGNDTRVQLNSTDAALVGTNVWGSTTPTSTVFTVRALFDNAHVAYCFAPVAGYSSFGSYTGNGSSDGPFVFCNFRPRWIMIKRTDAAYGWYMYDTARDTYNIAGKELLANASDAEVSDSDLDILSNGFKPRRSSLAFNASGGTFIYAAFAESPFQYARAR